MIRLIIFSLFISSFLLGLILFKGDFWKIYGLGFGSICKFKLGVNKYFSWSLLYTIIAIYFNIYISKRQNLNISDPSIFTILDNF